MNADSGTGTEPAALSCDITYDRGLVVADEAVRLNNKIWASRDACMQHYPRYCPVDCPNAGKHDLELESLGICECRNCRVRETDNWDD